VRDPQRLGDSVACLVVHLVACFPGCGIVCCPTVPGLALSHMSRIAISTPVHPNEPGTFDTCVGMTPAILSLVLQTRPLAARRPQSEITSSPWGNHSHWAIAGDDEDAVWFGTRSRHLGRSGTPQQDRQAPHRAVVLCLDPALLANSSALGCGHSAKYVRFLPLPEKGLVWIAEPHQ